MFRRLSLVATVFALLAFSPPSRAAPEPALMCWRAPILYTLGEHRIAFRIYLACAIAGDSEAQYSAAMMMRSGESNADGSPNPFGARVFLEQSASQGYGQAIYTLAKEYELGSSAFERDMAFSTELFRAAALLGHVDAQVDLGTQYLLGRGGVRQDDGAAAHWYERAAGAGHWGAQFLIASMYEHGNGVSRDEQLALRWYERARQGGDEVAPLKVEELRLRLATKVRQLRFD